MRLARGRLRAAPLFSEEADRLIPEVSAEDRLRYAYLRAPNGRLWRGAEAIWQTLYLWPGGWLLRVFRLVPGFHFFSNRFYRWYADNRSPSCRVGGSGQRSPGG